ncbi:hypothetical protein [Stenotrophomonas sp.]|nr:hypothetical protein [Stenotrophomonas sp.]
MSALLHRHPQDVATVFLFPGALCGATSPIAHPAVVTPACVPRRRAVAVR